MTRRKRSTPEQHSHIAIKVADFAVHAQAGFNLNLHDLHPLRGSERERVYINTTSIELVGVCTDPAEMIDARFEGKRPAIPSSFALPV